MLPKENLLETIQDTEQSIRRVQDRVRRMRLLTEWAFLLESNLVNEFTALRELTALLRHWAIPFLLTGDTAGALELFHHFGLSPVSPLLTGCRMGYVLSRTTVLRPWEMTIPLHHRDRLLAILKRRGLLANDEERKHPEIRLRRGMVLYGEDRRTSGPYDRLLPVPALCRFSFSRLFSVAELYNSHSNSPVSPADAARTYITEGPALPPYPLAGEVLSGRAYRALQTALPVNLGEMLGTAAGIRRDAGDDPGRDFLRRCPGLLESAEGRLLFRDQITDVLSYAGGIPDTALLRMHRVLESGKDSVNEREEFIRGAIGRGMTRREAASIWNTLTRNAPRLPDRFRNLPGKTLLWQTMVLRSRDAGLFEDVSRSILLL